MPRDIEKDLDVRTFVIEHTAAQLGVPSAQIADETLVPDTFRLFQTGVVRLGKAAGVVNTQHCTVGDAIEAFYDFDRR
jgi:hypothetical protein